MCQGHRRGGNSIDLIPWLSKCPPHPQQANLSSWIPENIKKKECVHFVERSKLSDAG